MDSTRARFIAASGDPWPWKVDGKISSYEVPCLSKAVMYRLPVDASLSPYICPLDGTYFAYWSRREGVEYFCMSCDFVFGQNAFSSVEITDDLIRERVQDWLVRQRKGRHTLAEARKLEKLLSVARERGFSI